MNFRSTLPLPETNPELRTGREYRDAHCEPLPVNRVEQLQRAPHSVCRPGRLILAGNRHYLRALRAAEMKAWEAGVAFMTE